MSEVKQSRRESLQGFVEANPNDAFARYGLALEFMNAGEFQPAAAHFRALIEKNPEYVPGYLMFGQLLARMGQKEDARDTLRRGIAAARRAGNVHALNEMESFLLDLGS